MIQKETRLTVADNSGAKIVQCIHSYTGKTAQVGDIVLVSIKSTQKKSKMKKPISVGTIYKALVIRTKYPNKNNIGFSIAFDVNSVILLNTQLQPLGTRIFGPISIHLRNHKNFKILSLASNLI